MTVVRVEPEVRLINIDTSTNQVTVFQNVLHVTAGANQGVRGPEGNVQSHLGNVLVEAGDGLSGGGTLDSNITVAVDSTVVRTESDQSINGSLAVSTVRFNTSLENYSPEVGELFWNSEDRTLDLETGGALLQIGQEQYYLVKNQTGNSIPNGQAVMAAGTLGASGRILASPAISDGSVPSEFFMGVATQTIANGEDGFVTSFGLVRGVDTGMFSEGDVLYADPQVVGGLSNSAPTAPNNIITTALVINSSNTAGSMFVRPTFHDKLQTLQDVVLNGLEDDYVVAWKSANTRFESVSVSSLVSNLYLSTSQSGTLDGNLTVTGAVSAQQFNQTSDARLKKDLVRLDNALETVCSLNGYKFNFIDTDTPSIGLLAQEVETVFPELVTSSGAIKTLSYSNLIAVLVEAVKEQQHEINSLKNLLTKLTN